MDGLRWILLGLGIIALAGIYAYTRFRQRHSAGPAAPDEARVEPSLGGELPDETAVDGEPAPAVDPEPSQPVLPEKVVTIRLMAKDRKGFPGDKLVLAMRGAGLRHGQFGIFHAMFGDTDEILFSVANLVEPGTFDLSSLSSTRLPGVSMFLVLPGPEDAINAFERMIETARSLAASLDGELLDEQGSSLSVQRERYIRDEIQQFVRANLNLSTAAGSEA